MIFAFLDSQNSFDRLPGYSSVEGNSCLHLILSAAFEIGPALAEFPWLIGS